MISSEQGHQYPFFQALFFGGQDKLPFFLAQVHVKGLDTPVDPCAAILVLIVTALLCLGIKEVAALSLQTCLGNFVLHLFSYAVISTFVVWILQSRFLFCVLVPFLDTSTFIHEINTDSKIWKCVDATLFCVVICAPVYIKMFLLLWNYDSICSGVQQLATFNLKLYTQVWVMSSSELICGRHHHHCKYHSDALCHLRWWMARIQEWLGWL